jgi:hypothetical protein
MVFSMKDSHHPISIGRALELLTKQERRQILRQVADTPDGTTVDELSKGVEGVEVVDSMRPDGRGSNHRDAELHHVHLPKLQEADGIEYDASEGTVHRGRRFEDVVSLLEVIDDHRDDSSTTIS